jgi:hypothetical protein
VASGQRGHQRPLWNSVADTNGQPHCYGYRNSYSYGNSDSYGNSNCHTDRYGDTELHAHGYGYGYSYSYRNRDGHSDSYIYSHCYASADLEAYSNTKAAPDAGASTLRLLNTQQSLSAWELASEAREVPQALEKLLMRY